MGKAKVLIVEDEMVVAKDIQQSLERSGYDVTAIAVSGEAAIEKAAQTQPDMVLMDIKLKGEMDGIEAAEQIRARFNIPAIYLTAFSDEATLQRAKITEPFGYILKPFEEHGLSSTIEMALYRHKMTKRLEESEERYRLLAETVTDVIWTTDTDLRYTYISPSVTRMMGYSVEEVLGQTGAHFLTPASLEAAMNVYAEEMAIEEEQNDLTRSRTMELEFYRKDGSTAWLEVEITGVRDSDGRLVEILGVSRDVSKRVQAEEERERLTAQIREDARRVQQIIVTVPEGVLLLDAESRVVLANPVAEKDLAVLVGRDVISTQEPITHLGDRPLAEFLTAPSIKGLWHEVDAAGRTFEIIARPMEKGHEPEDWVLVINDVTQEREIQRHVQHQGRLAAVGQLAAGIAHDFNNLMSVIIFFTRTVLSTPDIPAKLRESLETVVQQAYKATDLIQQILDFSRRGELQPRPMDLTPFLKEVVKLLERTMPENISLDLSCGREEYTVNADPTRVQQAIMNLAINARDAMLPSGGGELRIALSRTAATDDIKCVTCGQVVGREWIRITVTDTGGGIPPDVLPYIFEPFFTTKEAGQGTGLGLAQVYGIVVQHEGHIDVSTETGAGTTFTLYLPVLPEHWPETEAREMATYVRGQGETVLVVEDEAILRGALADTLELLNYQVLEAANGHEALDILERHAKEVALVLSDLVMPGMGGQALFHALRQRGLTLPVVMLSGHPMEDELENLQSQGLAGWMLKPPNVEQLSQLLARALGEKPE